MENTLAQLVTGAVGGAVVSSIIGPYVSGAKERRKARADALNALMQVETARWADKESTIMTFRQTVGALKAAALVAGVSNEIVDTYARLAATARDLSQTDFDESGGEDNPFAGGIPTDISDLARDAAEAVVTCVRHPWKAKLQEKPLLRDLEHKTNELKKAYKKRHEQVNWNIRDF